MALPLDRKTSKQISTIAPEFSFSVALKAEIRFSNALLFAPCKRECCGTAWVAPEDFPSSRLHEGYKIENGYALIAILILYNIHLLLITDCK
jgi:hypothetical protein